MQIETKNYTVKEINLKDDKHKAKIKFIDGQFHKCDYEVHNSKFDYDYFDWEFLHRVAEAIIKGHTP